MLFSHWPVRKVCPSARTSALAVEVLEDRLVPSAKFRSLPAVRPPGGPATHIVVIVPANVQAGQAFQVMIEVEDAHNRIATAFTGPVQLSLGSADANASLPASFTFHANNHGIGFFNATLSAPGTQAIRANTSNKKIVGSGVTAVVQQTTHFEIQVSANVIAGMPATMTISALDTSNHVVTDYKGTVNLQTNDLFANLPPDYTFLPADHGSHQFSVTFGSFGMETVAVTEANSATIASSMIVNVQSPNPFANWMWW